MLHIFFLNSSLTLDNCYVKFQTTKDKTVIMFKFQEKQKTIMHIGRTSIPLRPLRVKHIGFDSTIQAF